jgi:hypothetical protein
VAKVVDHRHALGRGADHIEPPRQPGKAAQCECGMADRDARRARRCDAACPSGVSSWCGSLGR